MGDGFDTYDLKLNTIPYNLNSDYLLKPSNIYLTNQTGLAGFDNPYNLKLNFNNQDSIFKSYPNRDEDFKKLSGIMEKNKKISTTIDALNAITGLANAYMGYKQYGLAKDTFNFQKNLANTNLINQAKAYNNILDNRTDVGLAIGGMSEEQKQAYRDKIEKQKLGLSKI